MALTVVVATDVAVAANLRADAAAAAQARAEAAEAERVRQVYAAEFNAVAETVYDAVAPMHDALHGTVGTDEFSPELGVRDDVLRNGGASQLVAASLDRLKAVTPPADLAVTHDVLLREGQVMVTASDELRVAIDRPADAEGFLTGFADPLFRFEDSSDNWAEAVRFMSSDLDLPRPSLPRADGDNVPAPGQVTDSKGGWLMAAGTACAGALRTIDALPDEEEVDLEEAVASTKAVATALRQLPEQVRAAPVPAADRELLERDVLAQLAQVSDGMAAVEDEVAESFRTLDEARFDAAYQRLAELDAPRATLERTLDDYGSGTCADLIAPGFMPGSSGSDGGGAESEQVATA